VVIASAQSQGRPVLLGEVASAMAGLIVDPPLTPFFQADQDAVDDRLLVFDGLLAQDSVNICESPSPAVGNPGEESRADGALAPEEPGTERDVPFFRVAWAGPPEVLDNLARGRFAGRIITRLPGVLTLVVDLGAGAGVGVDLTGAIGVSPADGSDAVQYRLVSVVLQHLGAPALHFPDHRFRGRWHFNLARPRRSRCR
jgi:hypothetical protein